MTSSRFPADLSPEPLAKAMVPDEDNIRTLVHTFYERVRDDALLGPVFEAKLAGRWEPHLEKMVTFWTSLVLGTKAYRGNVQAVHQPLDGVEPAHFSRWLALFLNTVEARYAPAAAVRFMTPALRIAQSLQLSLFGWDYQIPSEQQALLDLIAPPRADSAHDGHDTPHRPRGEPFPAKFIGRGPDDAD